MQTVRAQAELSLFGKLAARPDFVRVRCQGPASNELDQFLVRAAEQLNANKLGLRGAAVRYVFCAPGTQRALVGVLRESRDQVGREFPLTLFTSVPLAVVGGRLAALTLAYGEFLRAAELLLAELSTAPFEELETRMRGLEVAEATRDGLIQIEADLATGFSGTLAASFLERAFGTSADGLHCYGLFTLITAAVPVRNAPPSQPATVLDCPEREELDRLLWLELASRVLCWRDALPSCFWTEHSPERLLIALGAPPAEVLRAIADPKYTSQRLWPLTTDRPAAIERARAALPSLAALAADPALSAERLLTLVGDAAAAT